jgi:glycosyltransferase involved in cell wall biosynthesis
MPRVVIAHDFLETYGGAERVTQEMARAFPDAPVRAILARASVAARMGIDGRVETVLPARERILRHYRLGAPLYPALVGAAELPAADVLLTSSYAFAHHFRTQNAAPQVCYCHSPLRFAWTMTGDYRDRVARGGLSGPAFLALAAAMRRSDRRASRSVARYVTQSPHVAELIARYYGRTATVIGAPVDAEVFTPPGQGAGDGGYFLFCGRLVEPYKRAGATIEAFRRLGEQLVVAGDGPALGELRAAAPPNVSFTGHLDDAALVGLMGGARALVFPSEDDFGLIPLEAMACGRPVLAYGGGGAVHTVVPGVTGELFPSQDPGAIAAAVAAFDPDRYRPAEIREHALQWDRPAFRRRLVAVVEEIAQ